jgi:Predicted deacetylase
MQSPPPPKRLLASIHDVGPGFAREVDQLAALLERALGGPRYAMLVVPDHWGSNPLSADKAFQSKLRRWSDAGVDMFVHGWFHKDAAEHVGVARLKARHMTAGEGEFLGLDRESALKRMRHGKALIEAIIGRPVAGFVAPAWLYSPGALEALAEAGFLLAEDHWKVWRPDTGQTISRGPVITWASRSMPRTASSLVFAVLARRLMGGQHTVRIALHPGDVTKESLLHSIDRTLTRFTASHRPARYSECAAIPA